MVRIEQDRKSVENKRIGCSSDRALAMAIYGGGFKKSRHRGT